MTFERFFDDAAIFPPGNAPLDVAVKAHLDRATTADGRYVGPFVIDEARLPGLVDLLSEPLDIALVAGPASTLSHQRLPALRSSGLATGVGRPSVARERSDREGAGETTGLPDHPMLKVVAVEGPRGSAVEKPWGTGFDVPDGTILKLRCGGDYVPTVAELSDAITYCVEHDQPFKLTAGLHAAIATEHAHGFVNIMAAVVAAMRGKDPAPALMAWADEIDMSTLSDSRRLFRSIGTCDIDGPLSDLRALGLIP